MVQDTVDPKTTTVERPKVKLEEIGQGRGYAMGFLALVLVFIGLVALLFGGLEATHVVDKPDTQAVWTARQVDTMSQSYDQYVDEHNRFNEIGGVVFMGVFCPLALIAAYSLCVSMVNEMTKCPRGHVIYKAHSYCPRCGEVVYSKDELSPQEWQKRYMLEAQPKGMQPG